MTSQLCVRDLMTSPVETVERNAALTVADEAMKKRKTRHVVAVDEEGNVAGVISNRGLFLGGLMRGLGYGSRAKEQALESLRVKDAMTCDPVTVSPDVPVQQAAALLLQHGIGCLPVLAGTELVGIVTEGDFVALIAKGSAPAP